jgi:predicted nucleic acid-binding protein
MIYVDSGIIIRMLEGVDRVRRPILQRLQAMSSEERILVTSRLSSLECCCKPLRENQPTVPALYRDFFHRADEVVVKDIDAAVIEAATEVRARAGLRTPDAIHAGTAVLSQAKAFWTTDKRFLQCPGLPVELFAAT